MKILWNGPVIDPSGYGNCARAYIKALYSAGHSVNIDPVQYFSGNVKRYIADDTYEFLLDLYRTHNKLDFEYTHIEHKTPGIFTSTKYRKNVGYSVWETNRVPQQFVSNICIKDELWTASKYSKVAFINAGVGIPIHIIPHIVDTDAFCPLDVEPNILRILFNGEFTHRKGVDILIKAYTRAFVAEDNVVLLLKTCSLDNKGIGYKYIKNAVNEMVSEINNFNPPKIKILTDFLTDEDLPKLYNVADVFVSASRGEGFGIPIAEAMASGNIVIAPDKGGHVDFCNNENAILIDSDVVDIPDDQLEDSRKVYTGQQWIEPSSEYLIGILKDIYKNRQRYTYLRTNARTTIKEYCNSARVVKLIEDRL